MNLNKTHLPSHLALLATNLIYALNYFIAKDLMPHIIKPSGFVLLRVIGALLLFGISGLFIKEKVQKTDHQKLFICAIFGVVINQIFFFKGLSLTSPVNASIIMISNPIMVVLLSVWILKESISLRIISGVFMGAFGSALLISGKTNTDTLSDTFGDLMILLNAFSYALYLVMVKPLMKKYTAVTVMKWVFLYGAVFITPLGFNQVIEINWQNFNTVIWQALFFVIVFTTFIAYLLNTYALKKISPSVVSSYIYLQPLITSVISLYLQYDYITSLKIISALLIIAGVYLVSNKNNP
jgi:drug/metabolite transporter (DMT)-like permease